MHEHSESVPAAMREPYEAVVRIIDEVCAKHLNAEYATLARQLTAALARKRPSPIERGKPEVWACGVLHALGTVNFLWDKSQTPHIRADELCRVCGVSPASGSAKAKQIRDLFHMRQMDPEWSLPSMMDRNPFVWLITVNGLPMDARYAPREVQEIAYEKGLIPYIPADKKAEKDSLTVHKTDSSARRCGLCGSTTKPLTRTPCCNNWICDDADQYVLFSYATNSCYRNHDRYTLCSSHYHENHKGRWQDCEKCRSNVETEMYVWYGTNEYNFEELENPPEFEPTHCHECGSVIHLGTDGYLMAEGKYFCERCGAKRVRRTIASERIGNKRK